MVSLRFLALMSSALLLACSASSRTTRPPVPVQVGGDQYDACPSKIEELNLEGGHYVEVRRGPGREYPVVARLEDAKRQSIYLCDSDDSDTWYGIVFTSGPAETCEVHTPQPEARADYQGPCAQGWIQATDVRQIID
jgi:hypothetical protein